MKSLILIIATTILAHSTNISGEAFLKDMFSGKVTICQGEEVILVSQEYFSSSNLPMLYASYGLDVQMMRKHVLSGNKKEAEKYTDIVSKNKAYINKTTAKITAFPETKVVKCGLNGKFNYTDVAEGNYTIGVAIKYKTGIFNTAEFVYQSIEVKDKDLNIIVSSD